MPNFGKTTYSPERKESQQAAMYLTQVRCPVKLWCVRKPYSVDAWWFCLSDADSPVNINDKLFLLDVIRFFLHFF